MVCTANAWARRGEDEAARLGDEAAGRLAKLSRHPVLRRITLLRQADCARARREGDPVDALRRSIDILSSDSSTQMECAADRSLLVDALTGQKRFEEAERVLSESPIPLGPATLGLGGALINSGETGKAEGLLRKGMEVLKGSRFGSRAAWGLATLYEQTGDRQKWIEMMEILGGWRPFPPATNVMDTRTSDQLAVVTLAKYYEGQKRWREALQWYERWRPPPSCIVNNQLNNERDVAIARCRAALGE